MVERYWSSIPRRSASTGTDATRFGPRSRTRTSEPTVIDPSFVHRSYAFILVIGISAAMFACLTTPYFQVEHVVLRRIGAIERVPLTTIASVASVVGQNIFKVSTIDVARQVAQLPGVRRARVLTHLPGTVEIEVEERTPVAIWRTTTGDVMVDDQGVVIAEAAIPPENGAGYDLVVIVDSTGTQVQAGDSIPARIVLAARELITALGALGMHIQKVEYSTAGLVVYIEQGVPIILGDTENLNAKLGQLIALREYSRNQHIQFNLLDIRSPGRPAYRAALPSPTIPVRSTPTPLPRR
ncbi:MAG: FtsQ-type POTRA domain-containing protein [Chloroflexi bacterium]|nr:FtsQ-type POTRA domain-containing protein [Chloroflexota bacterium]